MSETPHLFRMFDRYDILARITPGILAPLLPGASALIAFPEIITGSLYRALGSGIVSIGLLYLFASLARSRGRALQETLKRQWGGLPTEILLQHRDRTIEPPTKHAYHAALQKLAPDFRLPTADEETRDPAAADEIYRAVVRRLIDLRRGPKYKLIHNDNIAYGFWRNLLGMKGLALILAVLSVAGIAAAQLGHASIAMPDNKMAAIGLSILWASFLLILVRPARVWDAGVCYAERLFASLTPPSARKARSKAEAAE